MSLIPCPTCGMPRTAEDVASLECPICGHRELPPTNPAPPDPVSTPATRTRSRTFPIVLAGLGGVAIMAVLGTVAAVLQNLPKPDQLSAPLTVEPPPPAILVATIPTPSPSPSVTVVVPEPAPAPRFVPELAPLPREFVAVLEVAPRPRGLLGPLVDPRVIAIDRPNGVYELPPLRNRAKVQLVGRVDRLIVRGVEDGAALDALDLKAREVVIAGKVDGGSTARVRTTNGAIFFQAKVDGASEVVAEAPEGTVTFLSESPGAGPTIDGGAQVTVAARLVVIGAVTGADTRVDVTLHPTTKAPSFLRVGMIDGPSMVRYRNVAGSKGKPNVLPGELRGGAVLKYDK